MRIIAGEYRSRVIKAPTGDGTRPTVDRVRESMMSIVSSARGGFEGAVVLDVFAGSGALGLEALSRGAQTAVFCEQNKEALRIVQENAKALGLAPQQARVVKCDAIKDTPRATTNQFDVVFLDPPYAMEPTEALKIVANLRESGSLAQDALVIYEHPRKTTIEVEKASQELDMQPVRQKKYGDTVVDVWWVS